ncbi:putative pumilio homolog 8, chloroplastic [Abrus precatorius]|uniref:Pumilio homolog 8, chloroplastic n=1 Tax=Abrus precatorius TaxID=3816 RepID=A0A8B8LMX4_ABRPR|nr:putative pumilio homolog 8, chloroplastic [Abrus precatorius]
MLKISDDTRRNNDVEPETRFVGIPSTPTTPSCLRVHHHLHPDHVAVGSPVNRVNPSSSSSANGFHSNPYAPSRNDHKFWFDSDSSNLCDTKWVNDLGLSNDFSRMNISVFDGTQTRGYEYDACPFQAPFSCFSEPGNLVYEHLTNAAFGKGYTFGTPFGSSLPRDDAYQMYHHVAEQRKKEQQGTSSYQLLCDRFMGSNALGAGMDSEGSWRVKSPFRLSQMTHTGMTLNPNAPSHFYGAEKERAFTNNTERAFDPAAFRCDNSIIIQGKDVKHCIDNGFGSLTGCRRTSPRAEVAGENVPKNFSHGPPSGNVFENNGTLGSDFTLPMLLNFYSLDDVQGHMYKMAKDQNGCRFLQRLVDEGTYQNMCAVFEGIIGNVVELMMDSFGNYLVQKLLDVCNDEQKLQIVLMLTKDPGQLVRISLNTHGTRVVQKLIETLNSAKQISLVKSAIQPGFLDLIKDLNGNHVIQRCLQCLSCQDNQFIFEAAVKFCVDIATHRHGCCVLQRCIDHSVGKQRDKLVTEICKHGLLLAQDPFGNYVVQYIIEMETPNASSKLLGQFKGNYVNMSTQKFSSHVVEKCLKHIGDSRSRIVRELLSAPHFEQLLQDPYANYVIQSALTVTKGSLHASLVEAVRPHKILRTSPYCKRIFSGSLLKK